MLRMRLATIGWLLVPVAIGGCGGSNSGAPAGVGGQDGSTGFGFDHMCTPTTPESLREGFFTPLCPPEGCTEERKRYLQVSGDISEFCENATEATWDPDLGIFTIRGKLRQGTEQGTVVGKSECGLVVQFGSTSAIQDATNVPSDLIGRCGALPNSAQYTRTDNAENGLNAKTYQLTSGVLFVGHLSDDALAVAIVLSLERITISPDEMPEKIQIEGPVIACARTPGANDGGICPAL